MLAQILRMTKPPKLMDTLILSQKRWLYCLSEHVDVHTYICLHMLSITKNRYMVCMHFMCKGTKLVHCNKKLNY